MKLPPPSLLLLLLLGINQRIAFASEPAATQAVSEHFSVTVGLCISDDFASADAAAVRSGIECAAECSRSSGCLACHGGLSSSESRWLLLSNASIRLTPGDCKIIAKLNFPTEICATNATLQSPFLALNSTGNATVLIELLCTRWCWRLATDGLLFAQVGAAASIPEYGRTSIRCSPLTASDYFANAAVAALANFPLLSMSLSWRRQFTAETWCTDTAAVGNVPPAQRLDWSQPHRLDVCAQACALRPTCEFFIFNNSGCFEGSISLYLNSKLNGLQGCSLWHKARTWASSMLAFYTFNSSMLNLVNPAVMPAENNTPVDVGPEGVLIPLSISQFVRLNLSHIGFDALVRANTPFTFVITFSRGVPKSRSEFVLFASCSNIADYNGAINEQASRNEGWFLNSLTGEWLVAKSVNPGSTNDYWNNSAIQVAMALGPTSGYFVVNGVQLDTNFYTAPSTYGTDPSEIGCLYLGMQIFSPPTRFLFGRIRNLGIFTKMLSAEEVVELV